VVTKQQDFTQKKDEIILNDPVDKIEPLK